MRKDMMQYLAAGLFAGRDVTRCQRRTKVYRLVRRDLADAKTGACPAPVLEVYRGRDVSGDVYAVVLTGRSPISSAPAMTVARLSACQYYHVLLFEYALDGGRWFAVLTKEDIEETAKGARI